MMYRIPTPMMACAAIALLAGAPAVRGDDVTDAIAQALEAYTAKDYSTAAAQLETATQLIRQARADALAHTLPDAPTGWTADEVQSSAQSMGALSMVTASREYHKGDANIKIEVQTDSPYLQQAMMWMTNPMIAASSGQKLQIINRQKCLYKYDTDNKSGEVQIVAGGKALVKIDGSSIDDADLKLFINAIDFAKLSE